MDPPKARREGNQANAAENGRENGCIHPEQRGGEWIGARRDGGPGH